MTYDKTALKAELVAALRSDLAAAIKAHQATVAGSSHEEAKPENDKDTRALEQSYLARGQAERVEELRAAVAEALATPITPTGSAGRVALGALVRAAFSDGETAIYWVAPSGGGTVLQGGRVRVVTPRSPLGRALVGRVKGDEAEVVIAGKARAFELVSVDEMVDEPP
jgi:transcription elongation GreA/GreB family factor